MLLLNSIWKLMPPMMLTFAGDDDKGGVDDKGDDDDKGKDDGKVSKDDHDKVVADLEKSKTDLEDMSS